MKQQYINQYVIFFLAITLISITVNEKITSHSTLSSEKIGNLKARSSTKLVSKDHKIKSSKRIMKTDVNKTEQLDKKNDKPDQSKDKTEQRKINLNTKDIIAKGWLSVSSMAFENEVVYPELFTEVGLQKIYYDMSSYTRINSFFETSKDLESEIPYYTAFYFRLNKKYLYYTTTTKEENILGAFRLSSLKNISLVDTDPNCFSFEDYKNNEWKLCGKSHNEVLVFLCAIIKVGNFMENSACTSFNDDNGKSIVSNFSSGPPPDLIEKEILQKVIIIPTPSEYCNSNWNYDDSGSSWECGCKEGLNQSPIDLPPKASSVSSETKPQFKYNLLSSSKDANQENKVEFLVEKSTVKIKNQNMGSIIMQDGEEFIAQEIVFHTPSEHTIEGVYQDLEMQIVHNKADGKTNKKVILSVFFNSRAGALNKFFEKINVYEMPTTSKPSKIVEDRFFIPFIFLSEDEDDMSIQVPFSFYTYQGSLTAPPCSENVIHLVVSDPIMLSSTSIELFKEAIRPLDGVDSSGNLLINSNEISNTRKTQPLNGRPVFHYEYRKYEEDRKPQSKKQEKSDGHYEKIVKEIENYYYVPGLEPSGIPNSMVISQDEALNKQ